MQVQSIQPTPNPNAFKFVVDAVLFDGTKNYTSASQAAGHELAEKMFAVKDVDTLFFCDRFVTVTMTAEADWRAVHEEITRILEASEGVAPAVTAAPAGTESTGPDTSNLSQDDLAMLEQINSVLDDRVRPALAGDGGGLEVLSLTGKTLQIRYQGACGSCPSSIHGTLMAIQNLLQSEVDADLSVVPA